MPGFFTSLTFAGLGDWLRRQRVDAPVVVIDNASRELGDRDAIVTMADSELRGMATRHVDVSADGPEALQRAGAFVMTGGDPFRLLADLRASGADRLLLDAHARGVPIAGQSAGAIVCGPSLEPIRITSPFQPPAGLDLRGLGITDSVILPHQDRPGRAALHRRAALAFSEDSALTALWDDEVLLTGDGAWCIVRGERRTRVATQDDAEAVADVFHAAAQQAWGAFLGEDRLARADKDLDGWAHSIAIGGRRFLVTEDNLGLVGFVSYHRAAGHGDGPPTGEVDLLYTHPRAWGNGTGRRLLERATWQLLCEGFRAAVLWTEARNERALAVYRQGGWIPDGAVDQRDYLGVPIRNLRHHIDLTRHAGGD
jgi:dipeptidase E